MMMHRHVPFPCSNREALADIRKSWDAGSNIVWGFRRWFKSGRRHRHLLLSCFLRCGLLVVFSVGSFFGGSRGLGRLG